jgi:hypothetical protein
LAAGGSSYDAPFSVIAIATSPYSAVIRVSTRRSPSGSTSHPMAVVCGPGGAGPTPSGPRSVSARTRIGA